MPDKKPTLDKLICIYCHPVAKSFRLQYENAEDLCLSIYIQGLSDKGN